MLLATLLAGTPAEDPRSVIEQAIQAERRRLALPALRSDPRLDELAARLALEIGEAGEAEFDTPSGEELLGLARDAGYSAVLVQELVAVDAADGCEIVASWNRGISSSEVYRRHEARDLGVAMGQLEDLPVYVVLVGVPPSPDRSKRRIAGVAPREYPIDDLLKLVDAQRAVGGLPQLVRSPELDFVAQETAARILYDPSVPDGIGRIPAKDGAIVVYSKVSQNLVYNMSETVKRWFQFYRDDLLRRGTPPGAGGGIATRGTDDHIEGVLAVALRASSVSARPAGPAAESPASAEPARPRSD